MGPFIRCFDMADWPVLGVTYRGMKKYILRSLGAGPKVVERLLRVFPTERMDEPPAHGVLTPRQIVAHLADFEKTHLDRLHCAVHRPGTTLTRIDLKGLAAARHYSDKDAFHEAEVFESRRLTTIEFIRELSEEDLHKPLKTPSGDEINILEYAASIVTYDMANIEVLTEYLATGVATLS